MKFIDEVSAERIGLERIMQRLQSLSPYGKHMKQRMPVYLPGCEAQLQKEWALIKSLLEAWSKKPLLLQELELAIHSLRDIRAIVRKASHGHVLEDVEFFEIKRFLKALLKVEQGMAALEWTPTRFLPPALPDLHRILASDKSAGFYLDGRFAPGLTELREEQRKIKSALFTLRRTAQEAISRDMGKSFNHQGRLRINKLEDGLLRKVSTSSQLVFVAETYTQVEYALRESQEMLDLMLQVDALEAKIQALEYSARQKLSTQVAAARRELLAACRRLGRLDLVLAKARLARELDWCVPGLGAGVEFSDFTNPVVKDYLSEQGLSFQPLSLCLKATPVTVITGANMGGKSVSVKSVGLAVAMAQMGLLVPASKFKFSLRSFVYYSQQDENPQQGLSTFGAEISSLARILPRRGEPGLYLLDEPARGTNPWEGNALVKAIAQWLTGGNSLTLIATHFPGLSGLDNVTHLQVAGLAPRDGQFPPGLAPRDGQFPPGLAPRDGQFPPPLDGDMGQLPDPTLGLERINSLMNYTLVPGKGSVPRDALRIAAYLGLAPEILANAAQELELESGRS